MAKKTADNVSVYKFFANLVDKNKKIARILSAKSAENDIKN